MILLESSETGAHKHEHAFLVDGENLFWMHARVPFCTGNITRWSFGGRLELFGTELSQEQLLR